MDDYSRVDDETPSFAISLHKEYRWQGIGSQLMVSTAIHGRRETQRHNGQAEIEQLRYFNAVVLPFIVDDCPLAGYNRGRRRAKYAGG